MVHRLLLSEIGRPMHSLLERIDRVGGGDSFRQSRMVNAVDTLNFLEAAVQRAKDAVFVHMSSNKVYGDRPNAIALKELATRWEYDDPAFANGISESFPIDQSKHCRWEPAKSRRTSWCKSTDGTMG